MERETDREGERERDIYRDRERERERVQKRINEARGRVTDIEKENKTHICMIRLYYIVV